ncbi:hypothetical protein [Rubritalea tangerina]|uniref:hypothetical protein n=1 Tax=Rubritalea tangerina TaxID=430798 RepID=UPI00361C97D6
MNDLVTGRFVSRVVIVASCALGCFSCDSDKKDTEGVAIEEVEVSWDWAKYDRLNELSLQTLPVDIKPRQSLAIKSEAAGILTLELEGDVHEVRKGMRFARMDVDTLAEQGERLAILEEKRLLEDMRAEKLDLPEKKRLAKEELQEARRKVRLMEMIMDNPAMEEMSAELFGGDIASVTDTSFQEAKDALSLAEQKMAWADEYDEKLRKGQIRIQEMDFAKNERNYEQAKERSVYEAPFLGELRIELDYVEGQQEYTVGARETIATLNDYSEIHGHLRVKNASWINLSPQRLYIQLQDRDRTMMPFQDDRIILDKRTRKEERYYVFAVPLSQSESLKRLTGTQMRGDLVYKLPEVCYIVPKYDLSLYALGKSDSVDWAEMVGELWPGAKVIAEGLGDVAISYQF